MGTKDGEKTRGRDKLFTPEELRDLKGDSSKLINKTGWSHEYSFETMLDEMIDYWLNYYKITV